MQQEATSENDDDVRSCNSAMNKDISGEFMRWILFPALLAVGLLTLSVAKTEAQNLRPCPSTPNVDGKIECLEDRVQPPRATSPPKAPRQIEPANPSFDCRLARSSVERAICSDSELAEWDYRMGAAFRRALEATNDPIAVRDDQRRWITLRDRICSTNRQIGFDCLLRMTKDRASTLSQLSIKHHSMPVESTAAREISEPQPPTSQLSPHLEHQNEGPEPVAPPPPVALSTPTVSANSNDSRTSQSQESINFILLLGIGFIAWVAIKYIRHKRRREHLIEKYGPVIAERILAGAVWQGMTNEQLLDSWGHPTAVDREVRYNKTKETWKYNQTGKNRFDNYVFLENDVVIGGKSKGVPLHTAPI